MAYQLSSDEYWEVDGTPLHTYAWSVSSLGGGRLSTPPLRGKDSQLAYRPGSTFRPKIADSRNVSLFMWVQGADPEASTGAPTSNPKAQFKSNLRTLQRLFYAPRRQIALTRRWTDLGGLHVATAQGQVLATIDPEFQSQDHSAFMAEVFLADPFYYDNTLDTTVLAVGVPDTVVNPGDDSSPRHLTVTFTGPLTNPALTNSTPAPDVVCGYTGVIAGGSSVTLDVSAPRAVLGGSLVNSAISSSGSLWWMEMFPGNNVLTLTASAGTGTCTVSYRPAYF